MPSMRLQPVAEKLARTVGRRSLLGRGVEFATGALVGAAAGSFVNYRAATAGGLPTVCKFPGPPCPCDECNPTGVCAKPCVLLTEWYVSGCWVMNGVTCCDCECPDVIGNGWCGCGSDWHNDPELCPN